MSSWGIATDPVAYWITCACWATFIVVWIVGSVYNLIYSPQVERRRFAPLLVFIAIALWLIARYVPPEIWRVLIVRRPALEYTGCAVLIAGTAFTIWSRVVLGKMWTGLPTQRTGHELRTHGPYAVTRHPIYTGVLTMLLGTALANGIGFWVIVFLIAAIILFVKSRTEERLMAETFGAQYETYRQRVPALLPWPR
jgi:protein-S-isoprenylcysteine O-methyltransferase Ste14